MTTQRAPSSLPDPPAQLKAVQSYMKMAQDVERVDPIVSFWVRLFSTESAMKIDRASPECQSFLTALILWLENFKSTHKDNETVINQTVGQAHYENFVMALFNRADTLDREGTANKNTVRMFFMAAVLFEAMAVFGPLTDDISQKAKYAKFKAAYIQKCLKTGQTPKPGPIDGSDLDGCNAEGGAPPPSNTSDAKTPSSSGLDIPGVPSDAERNAHQQKPQDPFILNPSTPPAHISKPAMPPSLPAGQNNSNRNEPAAPPKPVSQATTTVAAAAATGSTSDQTRSTINETRFLASNGAPLKPEDIIQGQKYCKFANSALQYDDIPTAIENLEKALKLLTTGQNPE